MNERKVTTNIIYPFGSKYPTEYIKVYYTLNNELEDIIENSGYKRAFLSKYQKSLRFLEGLKQNVVLVIAIYLRSYLMKITYIVLDYLEKKI